MAWRRGFLLLAKFHPQWHNDKGIGTPKLKFLLRFDRNVEYKRPAGSYPLHDFHMICRPCTPFQRALAVRILLDLFKRLWSYRSFKLMGSGYPETMHQTPKSLRCKNVIEVLYHCAKFGGARISPSTMATKDVEFFSSVCPSRF